MERLEPQQPHPFDVPFYRGFLLLGVTSVFWGKFFQVSNRPLIWRQLALPDDLLFGMWNHDLSLFGCFDRLPVVATVSLILLAAYALGAATLAALRLRNSLTGPEHAVFAVASGLAWLSLMTLLVGWAGFIRSQRLIAVTTAILGVCGAALAVREVIAAVRRRPTLDRETLIFLIVGGVFSALILSGAVLPPWEFDVREYHLQAPKEWFQSGRIEFLPHNVYAQMPLATEMLALLATAIYPGEDAWFYGALAGKTLSACFAILAALGVFTTGSRLFSPAAGALGGVALLSTPWILQTSVFGLNEPALLAFGFLAFAALAVAPSQTGGVLLAGFFAGAAAACKYPGLVMLTFPLAIIAARAPYVFDRQSPPLLSDVRRGLLFAVAAAVVCGPWFVKNRVQTGNPVYPLAVSVFGGETRTPEKDQQFRRAHAVPTDSNGSRYGVGPLARGILQTFSDGEGASPLLAPLLVAGAIFLAHSQTRRFRAELTAAALCVWIFAVWWLATHRLDRFIMPALPFAALLGGAAWELRHWRGLRIGLGIVVGVGLTYCLLYALTPLPRLVRLDLLREGGPLDRTDPYPRVSAAFRYLNEKTPPGAAVLCVGDAAVFDLQPRVFYNTCFDDSLLAEWTEKKSAAETRDELLRRKVHFVCVNYHELDRYLSPGNYGYDPRFRENLVDELVAQKVLALEWTEPVPEGIKPAAYRPTKIFRVVAAP